MVQKVTNSLSSFTWTLREEKEAREVSSNSVTCTFMWHQGHLFLEFKKEKGGDTLLNMNHMGGRMYSRVLIKCFWNKMVWETRQGTWWKYPVFAGKFGSVGICKCISDANDLQPRGVISFSALLHLILCCIPPSFSDCFK